MIQRTVPQLSILLHCYEAGHKTNKTNTKGIKLFMKLSSNNGINLILKMNVFSFTQHFDLIKVTISICFARCLDGSLHVFHKPGILLSHETKKIVSF